LPLDENTNVTGEIRSVQDTPMDFRKMKKINEHLPNEYAAIAKVNQGYDTCYIR
jgi:aldose 1-epimerase